ncbi:glutathione transferase GstA [Limoniibacter endophyticus]|uniref:Glutathione S-transferase n=1 Tax=Limoniibacter endophyticus TaxID=1565040 RepID=A0A8J3GF78_9HYPH|nr:glutathione transferase GstA [Limoniibacter endophyticus]GHC65058.1 glutathione S-transferase [Limoniibacter endophyticus]
MKLYYATGTCSLSPLIVAHEAAIPLELVRVDIRTSPHVTETGNDYSEVSPNGYVPALVLDQGTVLTEGVTIVQYLADLKPDSGLAPQHGTLERAVLQSWLNFIATELHKMFSPWLFHPEYGTQAQEVARARIGERLAHVERHLQAGGPFLLGKTFTVADAYLFTVVGWSDFTGVDLSGFPHLRDLLGRIRTRAAVLAALRAEGSKTTG